MTEDINPDFVALRLKWALQALAAPAEAQLRHTPDFAHQVDELALDFDNWYRLAKQPDVLAIGDRQAVALQEVDAQLERMSGEGRADVWTRGALSSSPAWASVRQLAAEALNCLGWPVEIPPPSPDIYFPDGAV